MYPFGGLPENLAGFCALLRLEYGFRIGAAELIDALRALEVVDLSNEYAVRSALRTVLAGTRDDVAVFDGAFDRFFLSRPRGVQDQAFTLQREPEPRAPAERADALEGRSVPRSSAAEAEKMSAEGTGPGMPLELREEESDGAAAARASYSPVGVEGSEPPQVSEVDDAWIAAARALVRRVQLGPSRKWRSAVKGRRFDVRRTLRASLQTGGELLAARWLTRPRRRPRFIVLIDGSRSMSQHASTALTLASALVRATSRVEVFTFSTALQRVTTDVQRAAIGKTHRFRPLARAWGGGTTIGTCLAEFVHRFGDRLLAPGTVVIVASDGLDVGEPGTLRSAMQVLRRRSSALVWLNPLLDTPGYEPTALGMSVAKPFITTFTSVNDLAGFVRLSRTLRVRA
jgi:uncharacterized protein with von Willebrand factor type A (vWA) domain